MRKRSKRKVREASRLISPVEHQTLGMGPNMSLQMLLMGQGSEQDIHNVIGLLNLGSALAFLARNDALQVLIQGAQDACSTIIEAEQNEVEDRVYSVPEDIKAPLLEGFLHVDRIIALTTRQRLLEAAEYVRAVLERRITENKTTGKPNEQDLIRLGDTKPNSLDETTSVA